MSNYYFQAFDVQYCTQSLFNEVLLFLIDDYAENFYFSKYKFLLPYNLAILLLNDLYQIITSNYIF